MGELNEEQIDKEILPFLSSKARIDLRAIAMEYFLGLTGTEEGRTFIARNQKYLNAIVGLLDDDQQVIAKDAYLALINLTVDDATCNTLLNLEPNKDLAEKLLQYVVNKDSAHADIASSVLSNITRPEQCAQKFVDLLIKNKDSLGFDKIVFVFCQPNYNPKNKLHYLGQFLANLTQIQEARKYIMDKDGYVIQRLLPFLEYKESLVRRGGILAAIRNCCFEVGM